jgi:hypothetical protein
MYHFFFSDKEFFYAIIIFKWRIKFTIKILYKTSQLRSLPIATNLVTITSCSRKLNSIIHNKNGG